MRQALRTHASHTRRFASVLILFTCAFTLSAQAPLSDYAGTYTDEPGTTLEIVAGSDLFAVVAGSKYVLKPSGPDTFKAAYGQPIPFHRDAAGKVDGYTQEGKFHPHLSSLVSPEAAALAHPRPLGQEGYVYHPPADLHDGIAVGDIAATPLGTSSAERIVRSILDGTYKDVHSVLLYQHGKLVLEEYFYGYSATRTHELRSATKSVVSLLAGIAVDHGSLASATEPVLPHLAYASYANPDPRKASITLSNFLSMSSGLDCDDHSATSPGRETVIDDQPDWVKATLDLPVINTPGTKGFYCSGGVAVVGRMTENAVHQKLPDFAEKSLFTPLGIPRSNWKWNYDLTSADKEYSQIHLRPRDMLKLGLLVSNHGSWNGKQVISAAWIKTSTSEQSQIDNTSYGYFWWRPWQGVQMPDGWRHIDMVAAQGNGGQKIYLLPQYDLVAVFTGGDYNSSGSPPNKIMTRIILPPLIAAAEQKIHSPSGK